MLDAISVDGDDHEHREISDSCCNTKAGNAHVKLNGEQVAPADVNESTD